jgi:osmoprotectant transport system substrate-binding protein
VMNGLPRRRVGSFLLAALLPVLVTCSVGPEAPATVLTDDAISIGSFDFPESELLAEIYAQALEDAGFEVVRTFDVGPREVLIPALRNGLVELIPEYQGSALAFMGGQATEDDKATQIELVRIFDAAGLRVLEPAPAENTNTVVVTSATADRYDLDAISDLRSVAADLRFGGPPECPERPLCLAGLEELYGLEFAAFVPLDAGGPLTVRALHEGLVDVGLLFSTSEVLDDADLLALRDDRGLQPAEGIVPVARPEISELGPVDEVLNGVSTQLTTADLRRMNGDVANGTPVEEVAAAWLAQAVPVPPTQG